MALVQQDQEEVNAVAEAVELLLTSLPPGSREVAEVVACRSAGRRIVEARIEDVAKHQLLIILGGECGRMTLPDWCRRAVYEEARELFGHGDEPLQIPPLSEDLAVRHLHRLGWKGHCPTCRQGLPVEAELDRRERLRAQALRAATIRAMAVPA